MGCVGNPFWASLPRPQTTVAQYSHLLIFLSGFTLEVIFHIGKGILKM